ncbi:sigma-70 family RNA polymerase sigma factor [Lacticaseibacillus mingshuiensis]|uniref:Sigma-70 family RNA polymerase sigma factor n=1 Tax=Lacticaseibacillus mingshuiensis TaxID=2799574 RepID=A0ABW4CDC3_9LACO|nr:sigma-70 family RNA polymerase sigma factor [Lacticaseibacillus mingshuiensis]
MTDDEALVAKLRVQDDSALDDLIDQYGDFIRMVILHHLTSDYQRGFSRDIENRVYYQVWSKGATFDSAKGSFKNWLSAVIKHCAIDYQRGLAGTLATMDLDEAVVEQAPPDDPIDYAGLFAPLSDVERQVFQLYFQNDRTPEEIARQLHMRRGAVYQHLSRGKKKIREGTHDVYFS